MAVFSRPLLSISLGFLSGGWALSQLSDHAVVVAVVGIIGVCMMIAGLFGLPTLTRRLRSSPSFDTPALRAVYSLVWYYFKAPPIGPLAAMGVNPRLGQTCWALFYESTPAVGALDRKAKEAIVVGVSETNRCPFCIGMHDTMRESAKSPLALSEERALRTWAASTNRASRADRTLLPTFPAAGGAAAQAEGVGLVVLFNMFNRFSDCFAPAKSPTDMMPAFAKPMVKAMMGWMTGTTGPAGASFDAVLLTGTELMKPSTEREHCNEEELPSQLRSVLARSPALLKAVQAWSRACVREGRRVMKDGTRAVLRAAVKEWNGEQTLTAGKDIARLVDAAPHDEEKALLRLALTAAIAPSRLTDDVVEVGTDDQRVVAVAYGACEVSKEIGDRVASTFE